MGFAHIVTPTLPGFQLLNAEELVLPATSFQFLQALNGPTIIRLKGQTRQRRAVITLLHGNEPSGFLALYKLLQEKFEPYADTMFFVVSVPAALETPGFRHRSLPQHKDINRCFKPPYSGEEGQLAKQVIDYLVDLAPKAIIDLHNTSGSGPAFSVSSRSTPMHQALASHFTRWFIHTDIELGSVMEVPFCCPVVTIEAGGAQDDIAHINAYEGLKSFLSEEDVFQQRQHIEILQHPRRLEIHKNASLAFAERPVFGASITIRQDIEQRNFGTTQPGDVLGWVDHEKLEHFRLGGHKAGELVEHYFSANDNQLTVTKPLKFFMVTTRSDIAKSDCLLYFIESD